MALPEPQPIRKLSCGVKETAEEEAAATRTGAVGVVIKREKRTRRIAIGDERERGGLVGGPLGFFSISSPGR